MGLPYHITFHGGLLTQSENGKRALGRLFVFPQAPDDGVRPSSANTADAGLETLEETAPSTPEEHGDSVLRPPSRAQDRGHVSMSSAPFQARLCPADLARKYRWAQGFGCRVKRLLLAAAQEKASHDHKSIVIIAAPNSSISYT